MHSDCFGERMKTYEKAETTRKFMPMLPVYARIDGRTFSKFTKGLERPYDIQMCNAMIDTTKYLVKETNALMGYTQSDEISLVWYQPKFESEIFFAGKIQKMVSVLASMATTKFYTCCLQSDRLRDRLEHHLPTFDCRVFQLPNKMEAANTFLWREQDATKNAISMAARYYYAHNSLMHKTGPEMQEMLFQKGVNFNDYPAHFKRGTFVQRKTVMVEPDKSGIPEAYRNNVGMVSRSVVQAIDMPKFFSVTNRVEVIFEGVDPISE